MAEIATVLSVAEGMGGLSEEAFVVLVPLVVEVGGFAAGRLSSKFRAIRSGTGLSGAAADIADDGFCGCNFLIFASFLSSNSVVLRFCASAMFVLVRAFD